ncbi:MAG: TonB-dependent receptor [Bacteroidia bacterium]|nr:TonB-dependent receptor [Bacteroidia bacterium]
MKRVFLLTLLVCLSVAVFSQQVITGTTYDTDSLPLPGVTIMALGYNGFAISDEKGQFTFEVKKQLPVTLRVSLVGYHPQEVIVYASSEQPLTVTLTREGDALEPEVIITARRRNESVEDVPIPISVVSGAAVQDAGAFNVNRLKELVPSVQFYSSNPRNTTLNIRGMGSTFGLTNDGIDPGVGFYVDGVYFARPAAGTLDFIDVEQIEVLRGPQGTLFGKNTTAGTFNITTRKPSFTQGTDVELSYGNYGYIQAKSSVTGPLSKKAALRVSFSGTQRDGTLYHVVRQTDVNELNNIGVRGQLLYQPTKKIDITLAADVSRQRPDGYAQVVAGVVPTLRAPYRQFQQIIDDLGYSLPSTNPFDRKIDHDTPWRSHQEMGGASVNLSAEIGPGVLTATSAWRFWNWNPSNDRDFTGLEGLRLSQAPSRHEQWSQEIRYAGSWSSRLSGVVGVFAFGQSLRPDSAHVEEAGKDQWRFSQNSTSALWQTPGLLEGYGLRTYPLLNTFSGAAFGQLDWAISQRLHLLSGLRVNYDHKEVDFRRETYGGLQTTDPALLALQRSVYNAQSFQADIEDTNFSGQATLRYAANERFNTFATVSTGFKPVGLNLGGLPTANGEVLIDLAVVKPERVLHYEWGMKTKPTYRSTLNLTLFHTEIKDYQTLVQAPDLSVNRGYLANAEEVRVRGIEADATYKVRKVLSLTGSLTYTDAIYVKFTNAPPPLEETGGPTFKDISGGQLPGISRWAASAGAEFTHQQRLLGQDGSLFVALDGFYRSRFSSSPSPSQYLNIEGYTLLNARAGFRATEGVTVFIWSRNLLDTQYFEQLLPGAGNAGHYAGVLGDPRTYGLTLRASF